MRWRLTPSRARAAGSAGSGSNQRAASTRRPLPAGVREVVAAVDGPIVLVTNLLTEGRGMKGFTAGAAVSRISEVIGRSVDVVIVNTGHPGEESLARYADEHKEPLPVGDVPDGCEVITGEFWQGAFARHTRRRLAYAVWGVLSQRLLGS